MPKPGKRRYFIGATALILLAFGGAFAWRQLQQAPQAPAPATQLRILHEGDSLPGNLQLVDLQGRHFRSADFAGKALFINFWAAWCGPCLEEMPELYALYKNLHKRGLEILGVDMDEDLADGAKSLKAKIGEPPFPLFRGTDSDLFNSFDINGLPFSVLVDKKGVIRYAEPGEMSWTSKMMQKKIEELF